MLDELYQQIILDHNAKPKNYKKLENCTHQAEGYNPLCGDKISIYLILEDDIITDISFQGDGCAISKASGSMLTEELKGKSTEEALDIFDDMRKMFLEDTEIEGKLSVFAGVKQYPMRVKCVTMAWHTLKDALKVKDV